MYVYWLKGDLRKWTDRERHKNTQTHRIMFQGAFFVCLAPVLGKFGRSIFPIFSAGDELFCARTRDGHCHVRYVLKQYHF